MKYIVNEERRVEWEVDLEALIADFPVEYEEWVGDKAGWRDGEPHMTDVKDFIRETFELLLGGTAFDNYFRASDTGDNDIYVEAW